MQILKTEIRKKIENAALNEFMKKGFKNASIRSIAKEATISKSNFYNYFTNKEELFLNLCNNAYKEFNSLITSLLNFELEQNFTNENYINSFINELSLKINKLISQYKYELILLFDCSYGTNYQSLKNNTIAFLERHFSDEIEENHNKNSKYFMHIIATNLIESILEITRHYQSENWGYEMLQKYFKYHIRGISQFFI